MSKWVTNVIGGAKEGRFEISVVRDDNEFGKESFGWFDENKVLISHSGGPCRNTVSERIWKRLIQVAEVEAEERNRDEA